MSAVVLLGGCSSDARKVEGDPPTTEQAAKVCWALVADLPDTVAGQSAIELSNGDGWAAAWGDPAIVLRCGVPESAALTQTSQCLTVNDVDWFATQDGKEADLSAPTEGTVDLTTVGRSVNVEVSVPSKWQPPADALVDVSEAVTAATESISPCT